MTVGLPWRAGPPRRVGLGIVGIAAVFGAAQLAMWAGGVDQAVFPLPWTVLRGTGDMVSSGAFWASVADTLGIWVEAMAISVVIGVLAGLVLGSLPWLEDAVRPVIEFLRPIPSVVMIPLVLLVVQDTTKTELVVIVFAAVWPILINTMYGLGEVDPVARQTLRSFGFGPVAVAWRVSLPSAAPFIATGVRIAASTAFVVAVAAELIGAGMSGIGNYLTNVATSGTGGLTPILAVAIWSGLLGLVINAVFTGVDRRVFRWHHMLIARDVGA
jgi:NitT/TauT family transport system permease protein